MRTLISTEERDLLLGYPKTRGLTLMLSANNGELLLEGTEDQFDELRDACSDLLLRIGFDESYEPTKEGEVLEGLIDKFLV